MFPAEAGIQNDGENICAYAVSGPRSSAISRRPRRGSAVAHATGRRSPAHDSPLPGGGQILGGVSVSASWIECRSSRLRVNAMTTFDSKLSTLPVFILYTTHSIFHTRCLPYLTPARRCSYPKLVFYGSTPRFGIGGFGFERQDGVV